MKRPFFRDRVHAGATLATLLTSYRGRDDVTVLALPRGGVPVGFVVAQALGAPLDVLVVRKLGVPGREELAMGAVASGGVRVLNPEVVLALRLPAALVEEVTEAERRVVAERDRAYRGECPPPAVKDRVVILVDDGLATGATMRAALDALRPMDPSRLVVAVPVGAPATCAALGKAADEVVCAFQPKGFTAVGMAYEDFSQTSDTEVRDLLRRAARGERRNDLPVGQQPDGLPGPGEGR